MPVSRRSFVFAGQTILLAAALPINVLEAAAKAAGGAESSNTADLLHSTAATFRPLVNTNFAVRAGTANPTWLTLLSVEEMSTNSAQPTNFVQHVYLKNSTQVDTFALHFYMTGESLPQGTYELQHPKLGRFSLFVVPSGPTLCLAIINHVESTAMVFAPRKTQPGVAASKEIR